MTKVIIPTPIFDNNVDNSKFNLLHINQIPNIFESDVELAYKFISQYIDNKSTYINYRKEIERLLNWAWIIAKKSILQLKRNDIENFIRFCQKPLESWIGTKTIARYITRENQRLPNTEWRPFIAKINKAETNKGKKAQKNEYSLSQKSVKSIFVIIGSFYTYLISENITETNPILQIRQKSKFIRKQQNNNKIPCLSETQWKCLISVTRKMADRNPQRHQRTLFIITAMYLMYLRISEFVANERWIPLMGHFYKDAKDNWWFTTVSKGNKQRQITVSEDMLEALKNWRHYLNLSSLPPPNDNLPLIPKHKGKGAVSSIRMLRQLIQECFDETTLELEKTGEKDEAAIMERATVHWLRHTGISDDINKRGRPIIHVRDDAGHASIATTDLYNDAILQARHLSGRKKTV